MLLVAWTSKVYLDAAMTTFADSYDLVQSASVAESGYDDDLLLANWNPALQVLATFRGAGQGDSGSNAARDAIEGDIDGFLDRVYALATHI
jgi:hypothetical protein